MPAFVYPTYHLSDALVIADTILRENAGKPMRRLTIFDIMKKGPSSSASRSLVSASSGYGLTQGGYNAEFISLTERGEAIVNRNDPKSKIDAVLEIDVFRAFFEKYRNSNLPSFSAAADFLKGQGVSSKGIQSCYEILVKNGEQVCLIQETRGSKRIVSVAHALEKLSRESDFTRVPIGEDIEPKEEVLQHSNGNDGSPKTTLSIANEHFVPSLHIDIQIHIAPDASAEQIDHIFASMGKHLFSKT